MTTNDLRAHLVIVAARHLPQDNEEFNTYDYSGGNIDDAYELGCNAGEVLLARELLTKYFPQQS